jgi:hypothetical protein
MKVCTIDRLADIPRIIALDEDLPCAACSDPVRDMARANLNGFCHWWLSDAMRRTWKVHTVIDGFKSETQPSMDAIFKFLPSVKAKPVAAFLILCQHAEAKKYPHYQLQAWNGSKPNAVRVWPRLMAEWDQRTGALREKGKKSIALEPDLPEADRRTLGAAIGTVVQGFHRACIGVRAR